MLSFDYSLLEELDLDSLLLLRPWDAWLLDPDCDDLTALLPLSGREEDLTAGRFSDL